MFAKSHRRRMCSYIEELNTPEYTFKSDADLLNYLQGKADAVQPALPFMDEFSLHQTLIQEEVDLNPYYVVHNYLGSVPASKIPPIEAQALGNGINSLDMKRILWKCEEQEKPLASALLNFKDSAYSHNTDTEWDQQKFEKDFGTLMQAMEMVPADSPLKNALLDELTEVTLGSDVISDTVKIMINTFRVDAAYELLITCKVSPLPIDELMPAVKYSELEQFTLFSMGERVSEYMDTYSKQVSDVADPVVIASIDVKNAMDTGDHELMAKKLQKFFDLAAKSGNAQISDFVLNEISSMKNQPCFSDLNEQLEDPGTWAKAAVYKNTDESESTGILLWKKNLKSKNSSNIPKKVPSQDMKPTDHPTFKLELVNGPGKNNNGGKPGNNTEQGTSGRTTPTNDTPPAKTDASTNTSPQTTPPPKPHHTKKTFQMITQEEQDQASARMNALPSQPVTSYPHTATVRDVPNSASRPNMTVDQRAVEINIIRARAPETEFDHSTFFERSAQHRSAHLMEADLAPPRSLFNFGGGQAGNRPLFNFRGNSHGSSGQPNLFSNLRQGAVNNAAGSQPNLSSTPATNPGQVLPRAPQRPGPLELRRRMLRTVQPTRPNAGWSSSDSSVINVRTEISAHPDLAARVEQQRMNQGFLGSIGRGGRQGQNVQAGAHSSTMPPISEAPEWSVRDAVNRLTAFNARRGGRGSAARGASNASRPPLDPNAVSSHTRNAARARNTRIISPPANTRPTKNIRK